MFLPLPSSAELRLWEMFSTPSWMSWAPPGDRVPPVSHPTACWLMVSQQVPHQLTQGEQNNGLGLELGSSKAAPWIHIRNPRPLGSQSPSMICRTWGCANTTEHSERNTESKCVGRSGFNAFLKLLLRRQH